MRSIYVLKIYQMKWYYVLYIFFYLNYENKNYFIIMKRINHYLFIKLINKKNN